MNKIPDRIFLQIFGDGEPVQKFDIRSEDVTWSTDRIFKQDVEYVRALPLIALIQHCDECGSFYEFPEHHTSHRGQVTCLLHHFGPRSKRFQGAGHPMVQTSGLNQFTCLGSQGTAAAVSAGFCDECGAAVPPEFVYTEHSWHCPSCSLHPETS